MSDMSTARLAFVLAAGACAMPCFGADPAPTIAPATSASATPQQQALQKQIDSVQMQMAAAMTGRSFPDYKKALDQFVLPSCTFTSVNGETVSYPKYLGFMQRTIATRRPGATEQIRTLTLTMAGDKALETAVADDTTDYLDARGNFGPRGHHHQLEKRSFFRVHWTNSALPAPGASPASVGTASGGAWKSEAIAFSEIALFVDGQPYTPPTPKAPTAKKGNSGSGKTGDRGSGSSGYSVAPQMNPIMPSVIRPNRTVRPHRKPAKHKSHR